MARGTFSGSNYFSRADAVVSAPAFTMQAWWYVTGWGADYQCIMQVGRSGASDHRHNISIGPSGDPVATCFSRSTASDRSETTISAADHNKWNHHLGVWRSSTNRQVYFNGAGATVSTGSINPTGLNSTTIGARTDASEPGTTMRIAEAAIWDIALAAEDIAALAKGFSPLMVRPDHLVEYMPLVRGNWSKSGTFSVTGTPGVLDHPRIINPLS